jgi:mannose-6-phosphate isomerase-like protein (cupin superfamily)
MTTATSHAPERMFSNPLIKDVVTFVETSDETGGKYTHVGVMLAPGGGNQLHRHLTFDEEFRVVQGMLGVQVDRRFLRLAKGETAVAELGSKHRFFNPTSDPVRFDVYLRPGNPGFEKGLRVAYGLARDGKTNGKGIPKNPLHLALIADLTDTRVAGSMAILNPVLALLAAVARRRGVDKDVAGYWS